MTAFERALKFTLSWEGGHSKDPDDAGGETYCGISRVAHPDWVGWHLLDAPVGLTPKSMHEMLADDVADFYRAEYWDKMRCGDMPDIVGIVVFDGGVNCGRKTAVKWLQNAVGAISDGVVGPKTLSSVASPDPKWICEDLIQQRDKHYDAIVMRNPVQVKFLRGWKNRTAALRKEVDCG